MNASEVISNWPEDSSKVAQDIIDKYGEPDEASDNHLIWHNNGPWVKTVVTKKATPHEFPMPHTDIVEQFIPYDVPADKVCDVVAYDGSVTIKRTEGLLSARCHDEPANFLAINLAHDIISEKHDVESAKKAYLQALIDFRQGKATPYLDGLQFEVPQKSGDKDTQMITKEKLESYKK